MLGTSEKYAVETYLEKDPVTTTNINITFVTFHLWLPSFYYNIIILKYFLSEVFSILIQFHRVFFEN